LSLPVTRFHLILLALLALAVFAQPAAAAPSKSRVQHLHFRYGPINIKPGANQIVFAPDMEKPSQDGYITRIAPNLKLPNGAIPPTYKLHLHHGVWINLAHQGATAPFYPQAFFASGEEKTIYKLPTPYGYFVKGSDPWVINYMIHDLVARPYKVYITYDVDFVPASSSLAKRMKPVVPIWMDVENGHPYPVFDVLRGSGQNGHFTFPNDAQNPYGTGPQLNEWTSPYSGTLVATAGHVHPGGLYDDLEVVRPGAQVSATKDGPVPGDVPNSVRIFRSRAHYFDKRGPVSWDVALTHTPANWRVHINQGDKLRITSTYDSKRSSWYEAMGIMIAYMAVDGKGGADPFTTAVPTSGRITHGHLPENNHHGGTAPKLANAAALPGVAVPGNTVRIENFEYRQGDLRAAGKRRNPPLVKEGQSLTFVNADGPPTAPFGNQISHSITACLSPCNLTTGISYPLANGRGGFDSGQLGFGPVGLTAFNNKQTWQTPTNLTPGTYTFFCRIHPFMRGAFRVKQ
jgi:plastocyanin